jgi:hypothetical protein
LEPNQWGSGNWLAVVVGLQFLMVAAVAVECILRRVYMALHWM